jgi:hypothetical protein
LVAGCALAAILIGYVFYKIGNTQDSVNKRNAVLFFWSVSGQKAQAE